ncbi:membrane protein [Longispora fulva]|nr:membrane protein [Longispora fulva]
MLASPVVPVEASAAGPATAAEPPAEPASDDKPDGPGRTQISRRLSGALIALLLAVVGFAVVIQVRSNATDEGLTSARQEDLVRILGDLDSRQERLRTELSALEESKRQLTSGAQNKEAALAAARARADELGILAGTLPAQGPGLDIRVTVGSKAIPAATVLDAIEELRGAGAEAMQISGANGASVRITASTYFMDDGGRLNVDGSKLDAPYAILVIGDPQTMRAALNIPGGVVDTVKRADGNVVVYEPGVVRVTALRQVSTPQYARPVS